MNHLGYTEEEIFGDILNQIYFFMEEVKPKPIQILVYHGSRKQLKVLAERILPEYSKFSKQRYQEELKSTQPYEIQKEEFLIYEISNPKKPNLNPWDNKKLVIIISSLPQRPPIKVHYVVDLEYLLEKGKIQESSFTHNPHQ